MFNLHIHDDGSKVKTQYPHDNKVACKNISLTDKIQLNKLTDKESKQSQYKIQIKSNKYPYDEKKTMEKQKHLFEKYPAQS